MVAIAVPVFALTWWLGCYLLARDPGRPVLRRAAAALLAYALAVACWSMAPQLAAAGRIAQVLLCVPALAWAGAAVGLLPDDLPERRQLDRGWLVTSSLLLAMVPALPAGGGLVALAPLAGGLLLLWRSRDAVLPRALPVPLTVAAALYGAGLAAALLPMQLGGPGLVVAALGVDLTVLGFLVALADAVDGGERLLPDLRRSCLAAAAAAVLVGGPATLTMLAAPTTPAVLALQFVVVAGVMSGVGLAGPVGRLVDRLAFLHDDRLRLDRAAAALLVEALPRRRERQRLMAMSEDEFVRLTRRALDSCTDLGRLLRSPLIGLPTVDRRLAARGSQAEQPLARAAELRLLLRESVDRLRPAGAAAGTTEDWQHYNALHFCCVLGLRPYERRPVTGLDRDARRAVDWFRRQVPQSRLRQWKLSGSRLVAAALWAELVRTDPRWLTRSDAAVHRPRLGQPGTEDHDTRHIRSL